ncbi:Lsr2 family protein [Streptomyces sp. RFCAC02]|uniref:histone-like nucleoid-structuring protein Lsr2 n=1 Tax=Streptomyces sp. RFCAC02 TaxID=2499143 RepID=UPI001020E409|nr:Lsr2 family protein [Streptomyces sp. RFCAC02]
MAKKVVTIYTDDLTGGEAADVGTHTFSLDGVNYEIDLGPDSFDRLLDALRPFIDKGRKTGRTQRSASAPKRAATGADPAKVREWARANGFEVNDRGRVPGHVQEAYDKAH